MNHYRLTNIRKGILLVLIAISSSLFAQKTHNEPTKSFDEVRRLISENNRGQAVLMCQSILEDKPFYYDVRVCLGRIYSWEKQYDNARKELLLVLLKKPRHKEALEAIVNVEMWSGNYLEALEYLNVLLISYPVNERYLFLKVRVLFKLNRLESASQTNLELLELNPAHKKANEFDEKLKISRKRNAVAVAYELDVFDKIYDPRHLLFMTLSRKTKYGTVIGRANAAKRFGKEGFQYEIDAYPRIRSGTYAYLNFGVSYSTLFPSKRYGVELYQKLPKSFEFSVGLRYLEFSSSSPKIITGSIGKYYKNYWFSLRPYFTPKSYGTSTSINLTIRNYLKNANNFISLTLGIMASTATGSLGKKPVSQLKGALTVPQPIKMMSNRTATNLFSIKNFMLLFSMLLIIKLLDIGVKKTQKTTNYPFNITVKDSKVYCLKIKLNRSRQF